MPDTTTTVADLRSQVNEFVGARDWRPFHNAKDLAVSIAIEAAELLEEYQWQDAAQVRAEGLPVSTGRFGAKMDVALVNQGPVTLLLDTADLLN
jgi:hypothetical protein